MKTVDRVVRVYICEVCGSEHQSRDSAIACESAPVPGRMFSVGDRVVGIEPRLCSSKDREYTATGEVIEIRGPARGDYEYFAKWLGGAPARNFHTWEYIVQFDCPRCGETKSSLYYARELGRK